MIGGISKTASPSLAILACNLIWFADEYNCPDLDVKFSNIDSFIFSTIGWTEQLIYKYQYLVKKDYGDLALQSVSICIIQENSIRITANKDFNVSKFTKGLK